jgi:hypothetical protein
MRDRLDEAERRRVAVAARFDRERRMVGRVIAGWVRRKRTRRPMLEALVNRQDHDLAGAGEPPGVH